MERMRGWSSYIVREGFVVKLESNKEVVTIS